MTEGCEVDSRVTARADIGILGGSGFSTFIDGA